MSLDSKSEESNDSMGLGSSDIGSDESGSDNDEKEEIKRHKKKKYFEGRTLKHAPKKTSLAYAPAEAGFVHEALPSQWCHKSQAIFF